MKRFKFSILLVLLLCLTLTVALPSTAQEESCPTIVQTAVDSTGTACQNIGRNQLCYGNNQIAVVAYDGVDRLIFAHTGDVVNVADVQSLQLAPLNEATGAWGVALMRIQANLPDTMPGQNVTFVLYGDVELENLGNREMPDAPVTLQISANAINLRTGPSTDYSIYTSFSGPATVNGRNEAGDWLRLLAPGGSEFVWVYAPVITVEGDAMTLPVVAVDDAPVVLQVVSNGDIDWYTDPVLTDTSLGGTMNGTFPVNGRTDAGDWLQVVLGEDTGWVQAEDVNPQGDISTLSVVEPGGLGNYGPMQAFYFRTGVGDTACEEAPDSGILVQTPQGAGEVTINVNGLEVALGSTMHIGSVQLADMPGTSAFGASLLEGKGWYNGGSIPVSYTQVFVQENGQSMPYGDPYPTDPALFDHVPLHLLPDPVYISQSGYFMSDKWGSPYYHYPPAMGVDSNGCVAVMLHNAGAHKESWGNWINPLVGGGWAIYAADMPDPFDYWGPWIDDAVPYLQDMYGYDCGVFIGSSIGANAGIYGCANWPDWCRGVVAYSPGPYGVYDPYTTVPQVQAPVHIATGSGDSAGSTPNYVNQLGDLGDNVSVQIFDSNEHGQYMDGDVGLVDYTINALGRFDTTGNGMPAPPDVEFPCPPDSLFAAVDQLAQDPNLQGTSVGDVMDDLFPDIDPYQVPLDDFLYGVAEASGSQPCQPTLESIKQRIGRFWSDEDWNLLQGIIERLTPEQKAGLLVWLSYDVPDSAEEQSAMEAFEAAYKDMHYIEQGIMLDLTFWMTPAELQLFGQSVTDGTLFGD